MIELGCYNLRVNSSSYGSIFVCLKSAVSNASADLLDGGVPCITETGDEIGF